MNKIVSYFQNIMRKFSERIKHNVVPTNKAYPVTLKNGSLQKRGCDTGGCGDYQAPRQGHTHEGIDILCEVGGYVYAPFDGFIERPANPYANDSDYKGFVFNFENGMKMKVFYATPMSISQKYQKGQIIGICQDISNKYSSVPAHIHVEMEYSGQKIDPTTFLF